MEHTQHLIDCAALLLDEHYEDVAAGRRIISGTGADTGSLCVVRETSKRGPCVDVAVDDIRADASVIIRKYGDGKTLTWFADRFGRISRETAETRIATERYHYEGRGEGNEDNSVA